MTFAAQLVCFLLFEPPDDVRLLVLPVPRFDDDHVVFANPDALSHSPGNAGSAFDPVHALHLDAVRAEHVCDDREHLTVIRHPQVLPALIALVLAHGGLFIGRAFKICNLDRPTTPFPAVSRTLNRAFRQLVPMRAVVFQGAGEPLTIEDVPEPECPPHGIVVETEACGICRSDWHAWQGDWDWVGVKPQPGQIFGHEPVGIVREVGADVTRFEEGDRVTTPFNLSDGTCPHCRAGRANICENIVPLGFVGMAQGAFAGQFALPDADHNAVRLPDDVDPVAVAALGCRFATAFHGLAHRVSVTAGDWVAVHGCGGVGLSAVHIAAALGATVVAVDIGDDKLDKARELGAHETVNVADVDSVTREIKRVTGGGANVSVDALGIEETCQNSVNCLVKGGQHLQIGLTTSDERGEISLPIDAIAMGEKELYGAFGMQPNRYDEIFRMIANGSVDPGKIVSETVSLDAVPEKLAALSDYESVGIPVVNEF